GTARVAMVLAAGHQPTADVLEFLGRLRTAIGSSTPVIAGLLEFDGENGCADADEDEREAWRRSLAGLDDPYLWVDTMTAAAGEAS
ncbi:MAG: DUF2868 domain-containing protein, partial [Planctomycetes bacterium]|nr:DUF2868 domain-containing protein [Planctomycetota bacterium]